MRRSRRLLLACLVGGAMVAVYSIGQVRAGVPTTTPLYYSGYLEDANGAVSDLGKTITVTLFDAASGGNTVCTPAPSGTTPMKTPVTAGRFRIALSADCTTALQGKSDVWVEVNVEEQPLPRSKIGAVPYALTAGTVDWGGVTGAGATTEWPGTIPYARVTNPRPVYVNANGKSYSTSASYCGETSPTTGKVVDGSSIGMTATKSLCEKSCKSPSAHMCTTVEVQRYLSTGGVFPSRGWYAAGVWGWDGLTPRLILDCISWTDDTAPGSNPTTGVEGPVSYPTDSAHSDFCNSSYPLLCCD